MGLNDDAIARYKTSGFVLLSGVIPLESLETAKREILTVGNLISDREFSDIDIMYDHFKRCEPEKAGLIYDACKRMVSIAALAQEPRLLSALRSIGCRAPAIVDVNFRIDSKSREQYLFGWHQDYWFSMGSKNGIVAWMPLKDVEEDLGGLELISGEVSGRTVYKVRPGHTFNSYADAIELDEAIPEAEAFPVRVRSGDVLLFRFDVLHKSLPVMSERNSRWTLQARFADFHDEEFRRRAFRPASVSKNNIPFLEELERAQAAAGER